MAVEGAEGGPVGGEWFYRVVDGCRVFGSKERESLRLRDEAVGLDGLIWSWVAI